MKLADSECMFFLNKKILLIGTVLPWACLAVLFLIDRSAFFSLFSDAVGYSFPQYIQELTIYFLGSVMIFLLPGLLWSCAFFKQKTDNVELLAYSFVFSLLPLIVIATLFKILFPEELNQLIFITMTFMLTFSGLAACMIKRNILVRTVSINKISLIVALILIIVAILLGWIFQDKMIWTYYDNNFSPEHILSIPLGMQDDLHEYFGLTDSLKRYLLPYWDLEYANKFGYSIIDPPFHKFLSLFLFLSFGESFGAISFNALIVIVMSYLLIWKVSALGLECKAKQWVGFYLPILFICYFFVLIRHHQYGVALTHENFFITFFTIAQLYFLIQRRTKIFLIFAVFAFLMKFEAILFTLLGLWFYERIFKPDKGTTFSLFKRYLFFIVLYIMLMLAIGIFSFRININLSVIFPDQSAYVLHILFLSKRANNTGKGCLGIANNAIIRIATFIMK